MVGPLERRAFALSVATVLPSVFLPPFQGAWAADMAYQPALVGKDYGKTVMSYSDFEKSGTGLLYKDAVRGKGPSPALGDRVVIDWTGYTIGYFGRPFETKKLKELNGDGDKEFYRFELGSGTAIPALEEGLLGMAQGGVRQLVVPPQLGYPAADPSHERIGPKPSTFSGQRALNFVLQNTELIDKTLLFNVKLIRVDRPGQNGWKTMRQYTSTERDAR